MSLGQRDRQRARQGRHLQQVGPRRPRNPNVLEAQAERRVLLHLPPAPAMGPPLQPFDGG
jgi:hypothetical protein